MRRRLKSAAGCCRPPRAQHLPRRVEKVAKEVGNPGTGQFQSSIQHQWCSPGSKHSLLPQHPEGSHHPACSTCHHCHSRTQQLSSWLHQDQASKHHGSAATQRPDSPLCPRGHTSGCGGCYWPIRLYEAEAYGRHTPRLHTGESVRPRSGICKALTNAVRAFVRALQMPLRPLMQCRQPSWVYQLILNYSMFFAAHYYWNCFNGAKSDTNTIHNMRVLSNEVYHFCK